LRREYTTEDGRKLRISAACIDSGGHHTEEVYRFCNKKLGRHIYAIKGHDGARPIWYQYAGRSRKYKGSLVWTVGVDTAKARIYGQLRVGLSGPGYAHFPLSYDEEFFKQLTSEQVMTRYHHGRPVLFFRLPAGRRNEGLDRRAYALAALFSRNVPWEILVRSAPTEPPPATPEGSTPSAQGEKPLTPGPRAPAKSEKRKVRFRFGR